MTAAARRIAPRDPALARRRRAIDRIVRMLCIAATAVGLFFLAWILLTLFRRGLGSLNAGVFTHVTRPPGQPGGLLNAIVGTLIQTAIGAAAEFGSVEKRIEIQSSFVSGLSDAMKVGIGSMVDADMEETSARLQALQVQQQLGIQSLSIANQAPQNVLSLFR